MAHRCAMTQRTVVTVYGWVWAPPYCGIQPKSNAHNHNDQRSGLSTRSLYLTARAYDIMSARPRYDHEWSL